MDKLTAGLLGVAAGLTTMCSAHAADLAQPDVTAALQASSYADLLEPIPNAAALLKAADMERPLVQQASGYFYFNVGPRPPETYYNPYYRPEYVPYYPPTYNYHHHHHHHHD